MTRILKGIGVVILIFVFIILVLGIYATFIERHLLISKSYKVTFSKESENKLRVVQFTDTQLGEFYTIEDLKKAINKINSLNPDIVVFTGDLIDNFAKYKDRDKVSDILEEIRASIGKYAIYGNHDYGGGAIRNYKSIMEEGGFILLQNSSEKILYRGQEVNIFGCDDALFGKYDVEKTMEKIDEKDINILLVHEPDIGEKFKDFNIDIILSGHSHGGQVYIPLVGPIKKNILSKKYNKGMYELNNNRSTKLYVNTGLGNTKVPFRFLNIPEITVFDIKF